MTGLRVPHADVRHAVFSAGQLETSRLFRRYQTILLAVGDVQRRPVLIGDLMDRACGTCSRKEFGPGRIGILRMGSDVGQGAKVHSGADQP